ncbi:MAG: hypothetical protein ACAI38_12900 [Myxococcota bacterium]|nr:hypothetical protein [Myxococcota bacterium]
MVVPSLPHKTVVLFALEQESRPFLRDTKGRTDIDVRTSGMGRKNAEAAILRVLAGGRPGHVITTGVTGGLRPDLAVGDIVFDTSDPGLAGALIALGGKPVRFATTEHVLVTVADRQRLREQTGADVVENESGFIRAICRNRGVNCTIIRAISDTADQDLPFDFNKLVGPDQNVDYCKVAWALLSAPWKLPALLQLWRNTNIATKKLSAFLRQALPQR